jgi:hypothetical protein
VIEIGVDEATGSQITFDLATGMNTNMIMLFVVDRDEYLKYKDHE